LVTGSLGEFEDLRASCTEDGLLARGLGGYLRITKKGREFVKIAAITDEEVADALKDAVRTRWRDRREALVSLVLFARLRAPKTHGSGGEPNA
jgi:hypothetical protein